LIDLPRADDRQLTMGLASALMVLGVMASGCSADEPRRSPIEIRVEPVTSTSQYVGPAQRHLLDPGERRTFLRAYDTQMALCVQEEGETLVLDDSRRPEWLLELVSPIYAAQPLGPVNERRVAQYGFHDPEATLGSETVVFEGRTTGKALLDRCTTKVVNQLGGEPPRGLPSMILDAGKAVTVDERFTAAQDRWSQCMGKQGYSYDTPTQVQREFTQTSSITQQEITAATASLECQRTARNIDTYVALLYAHEQRLIDDNLDLFAAFDSWKGRALTAAAEVIASHALPKNRTELPAPSLGVPGGG
jgi:hypothetical protein